MNSCALFLVVVASGFGDIYAALPSFINPCYRDDPNIRDCLIKEGNRVLKQFSNGIPELGVPPLDPLYVGEINLPRSGSGLAQRHWNSTMTGFSKMKITELYIDIAKKTGVCRTIGDATFKSNYSVDGQFLLFRMRGQGASKMKMKQMQMQLNWDWEEFKGKDGKNYTRITSYERTYDMEKAIIKMDGLFNGNKALEDTMNRFLNENWREIIKEVGDPSVNIVQKKVVEIFNIFYQRVTFDDLLPLRPK